MTNSPQMMLTLVLPYGDGLVKERAIMELRRMGLPSPRYCQWLREVKPGISVREICAKIEEALR